MEKQSTAKIYTAFAQRIVVLMILTGLAVGYLSEFFVVDDAPDWIGLFAVGLLGWLGFKRPTEIVR